LAKLPDTLARYPAAFFREGNAMKKTGNLQGRKRNERITAYLFIAPAVVLLIAFLVVPMIYTAYFSVFKYQIMRPDNIDFIGIDNYTKLFADKNFWVALKNTVYFTIIVVPAQCALALGLALLVSKKFRGVSVFRTMYFSPQLTSMVVIAVLWSVLYNANPNTGLINSLLVNIGLKPINFLTNEHTAMNAIIFMSAWQGAGYQMMIFLAGLQGIPRDQYEAASVDGATKWNQFRYITLPGLRGTIKYVIMITMIQAMKLFTQPYIMTQGGPKNATKTLVYYIYTQGFQKGNFGYACSIATVFFVIVVTMSLTMKRITTAND
jgi:fructooligosaccharide transport system permease protein